MEDPGAEAAKRQRIDVYGSSVRMPSLPLPPGHLQHPQHHLIPENLAPHDYSSPPGLRNPPAYHHSPIPPSPYSTGHSAATPLPTHPIQHDIQQQQPQQLQQHPGQYDPRSGSYGTPVQERPPPADTNPLHGVGNPSTTHSPEARQAPSLRPLETSFAEAQPYPHHPNQGTPPGYSSQIPPQSQPHQPPNGTIYHPQPMPMPQHYEHAQAPNPHGPPYADVHGPPYSAGPYGPPGPVPWRGPYSQPQHIPQPMIQKKGSRAIQACETCRQRKAKCDEGKPTCTHCKDSRVQCVYKEMQPAKSDRAQRDIMDALKKNEDSYEGLRGDFNKLDHKMDKLGAYLGQLDKITSLIESIKQGGDPNATIKAENPLLPIESPFEHQQTEHNTFGPPPPVRMASGDNIPTLKAEDSSTNLLTAGHTVMAQRLLQWRSIKELLANKAPEEDYCMAYEERKGLLRLYGKGQGQDLYDGALSGTPSSPGSSASDEANMRSPHYPMSEDFSWGGRSLGVPNIVDGKYFGNEKFHLGGLTARGDLQLDKHTMIDLMDSYLSNIHILHPFLDRVRLRRMVEKVWKDYNPIEAAASRPPFSPSAPYSRTPKHIKRKWSIGAGSPEDVNGGLPYVNGAHAPTAPDLSRRISTAIVLLVMALGKICQYADPLPGFAPEAVINTSDGFQQAMSPMTNASSPRTPGDLRGITGIQKGSVAASINSRGMRKGDRNIDVVPGLAYFAEAASILGTLQGNDLSFAQAYLLAALYTAQLACVIESWTWINNACRVCCFLVRDTRFTKEREKKRVDLTRFVYLACLQLESDILAELDLSPSGLQQIDPEGQIGVPSGVVEDAQDIDSMSSQPDDILLYYNYQLSLRKCMNDWQRHLYPASRGDSDDQLATSTRGNFSLDDREYCESTLSTLREMMQRHHELSWQENDPPPTYINAARLRGKYYGAKYFIHRPFLRYALHTFTQARLNPRVMGMYYDYVQNPSKYKLETVAPPGDNADWWTFQFLMSCHMCVAAAQKSTVAFDGVLKQKRLMVTNLFGTAHAQFGNMLVLAAVHSSKLLSFLLDEDAFKRLLDRTIDFLRSLAPISSTLKKDSELLSVIRDKISHGFKGGSDYVNPTGSFGSNMTPT